MAVTACVDFVGRAELFHAETGELLAHRRHEHFRIGHAYCTSAAGPDRMRGRPALPAATLTFTWSSAPNSIVRSLSCAAHFESVATLVATVPSNATWPLVSTLTGLLKSKTSGDRSSVNSATPLVVAFTVLPVRTRSTRPFGSVLSNMSLAACLRSGSRPRAARRCAFVARACR